MGQHHSCLQQQQQGLLQAPSVTFAEDIAAGNEWAFTHCSLCFVPLFHFCFLLPLWFSARKVVKAQCCQRIQLLLDCRWCQRHYRQSWRHCTSCAIAIIFSCSFLLLFVAALCLQVDLSMQRVPNRWGGFCKTAKRKSENIYILSSPSVSFYFEKVSPLLLLCINTKAPHSVHGGDGLLQIVYGKSN